MHERNYDEIDEIIDDDGVSELSSDEFSLESIITEYSAVEPTYTEELDPEARSRQIVREAIGETIATAYKGPEESKEVFERTGYDYWPEEEPAPQADYDEYEADRGYDEEEDVKTYFPKMNRNMHSAPVFRENDAEMRDYSVDEIIAEAERTAAAWKIPGHSPSEQDRSKRIREQKAPAELPFSEDMELIPPPEPRAAVSDDVRRSRVAKIKREVLGQDASGSDEESVFRDIEDIAPQEPRKTAIIGAGHGAASGVSFGLANEEDAGEDDDVRLYRKKRRSSSSEYDDGEIFNDSLDEDVKQYVPGKPLRKHIEHLEAKRNGFFNSVSTFIVSLLAMLKFENKKEQTGSDGEFAAAPEEEYLGPEVPAEDAAKYYGGHINSLRLRFRFALALTVILSWISFGLPVAGSLKTDLAVASIVCVILELAVIMLGLDIFTKGITSVINGKPSIWSLLSFSCIVSLLDGAVTAATGKLGDGLPFCAVSAISMTFALWGSLSSCRAIRHSTKALALSKEPYTVTTETDSEGKTRSIIKTKIDTAGYVNRCEEPDITEEIYNKLSVVLILSAFVLALIVTAIMKDWRQFFHVFAGITVSCAPFSAFLAFPLPFSRAARKMFRTGAAVAGWPGVRDIGLSKHMIVTDSDIFPPSAIVMESVRVLDGLWPEKVISAAGSIICASGSGASPIFMELMEKNGCFPQKVEEFYCHEGGGLTAIINGEEIVCGSSGFMNLMSIRLPQRLSSESAVYVSINGTLSGIFSLKYKPLGTVQAALSAILHVRRQPIFAVKDFLVTPLMISKSFKIPTDGLDFPTFAKRYEIASMDSAAGNRQAAAIISREGLGAFVHLSERARRLYGITWFAVVVSLLCTVLGMGIMSWLLISGSFAVATVGNLSGFMFIGVISLLILTYGIMQ